MRDVRSALTLPSEPSIASNWRAPRSPARNARWRAPRDGLVFIASLNEWSEGHTLEPDTRFGYGWLEAVRACRA